MKNRKKQKKSFFIERNVENDVFKRQMKKTFFTHLYSLLAKTFNNLYAGDMLVPGLKHCCRRRSQKRKDLDQIIDLQK